MPPGTQTLLTRSLEVLLHPEFSGIGSFNIHSVWIAKTAVNPRPQILKTASV